MTGFGAGWAYTAWIQPDREVAQAAEVLETAPKRIVYLHGSDYPDLVEQLAPEGIAGVTSFAALVRLDAKWSLDGIIFDANLREQLDAQWLQAKYRAGVAIGAVGMTIGQLTQWIQVPTPSAYQNSASPGLHPNIAVIQIQITARNPEDAERFWAHYSKNGTEDHILPSIEEPMQIVAARVNYDLSDIASRSRVFSLIRENTRPAPANR